MVRAADVLPDVRRQALGELLACYMAPIRTHLLRRQNVPAADVDDVLQGFLADRVLEANLIGRADPARGRFRTFLLTALERYLINRREAEAAAKRRPAGVTPLSRVVPHAAGLTPDLAFDVAWAREVLDQALAAMREECEAGGRAELWAVFDARVLAPTLDGAAAPANEELAARLRLAGPDVVSNRLVTAKRMFLRHLRAVVGQYEADDAAIDAEIADLRAILARGGETPPGATIA